MKRVTFVTGNRSRHDEARQLLAGVDVDWARLTLARPDTSSLELIATARVKDAFGQLGTPCFVENTAMYLDDHQGQPGTQFKKLMLELGVAGVGRRLGGSAGQTRVVVAYTKDGEQVALFEGLSEGQLIREPRGTHGYGWDSLWVPNGYTRTLAELATSKFLVNMRHAPFLELGALLRGDGFDGVFESHITVAPCDTTAFAATCSELGVKCVVIELPRGDHPTQPMTAAHHRGALSDVLAEVHQLAQTIVRRGYPVTRTKLEALGRHRDAPMTDEAARLAPKANYYEHHLKVVLPKGYDSADLAAACEPLEGHLSRNARKQRSDGSHERFITVRSHRVGQLTADARCERLVELVRSRGLEIRNRVREYTVYDSAIDIDRNWASP